MKIFLLLTREGRLLIETDENLEASKKYPAGIYGLADDKYKTILLISKGLGHRSMSMSLTTSADSDFDAYSKKGLNIIAKISLSSYDKLSAFKLALMNVMQGGVQRNSLAGSLEWVGISLAEFSTAATSAKLIVIPKEGSSASMTLSATPISSSTASPSPLFPKPSKLPTILSDSTLEKEQKTDWDYRVTGIKPPSIWDYRVTGIKPPSIKAQSPLKQQVAQGLSATAPISSSTALPSKPLKSPAILSDPELEREQKADECYLNTRVTRPKAESIKSQSPLEGLVAQREKARLTKYILGTEQAIQKKILQVIFENHQHPLSQEYHRATFLNVDKDRAQSNLGQLYVKYKQYFPTEIQQQPPLMDPKKSAEFLKDEDEDEFDAKLVELGYRALYR